ncbi:MAG: glycosyltransferase [Bdellovibrionaceae bacterium]|nr:glycosyltransferase [Pseudobdellovibrionaceae bacterium]
MKIALLHHSRLPVSAYGGIERVVISLAIHYRQLGHDVILACAKGSRLEDFEIFELPSDYQSRPARSWLPKDIDFLHAHEPLPILPELPYLVTVHGNGQPGERYPANTNFLSASHAANHKSSIFVYNGIEPSQFPFVREKSDYFVFLARARWRVKNLKSCIHMAREVGVPLHVIGGEGRSTREVRYHGLIGEREGKLEILARARALLYPTNWNEPFGLAVTEALACGTPVIASLNGAMKEIVSPDVGVTCRDYEEFVRAPAKLDLIHPSACRERVEKYFSARKMAESYLQLINRIRQERTLPQSPATSESPEPLHLIYKPTLLNRLRLKISGKV